MMSLLERDNVLKFFCGFTRWDFSPFRQDAVAAPAPDVVASLDGKHQQDDEGHEHQEAQDDGYGLEGRRTSATRRDNNTANAGALDQSPQTDARSVVKVVVEVLVQEDALGLALGLVLGTQLLDLAVVDGPRRLGRRVHRHQVHDRGDDHEERQDGADDDGCQVELRRAGGVLPRNHQDEYDEHGDEGDGGDGDDEAFSSCGIHFGSSRAVGASGAAGAAPVGAAPIGAAPVGAAPVGAAAAVGAAAVTRHQAGAASHSHEAHVVVPGQCGGHAGKHSHAHDDDDDAQDLHHSRGGSPAVEVKHIISLVVGVGRIGRVLAVFVSAAMAATEEDTR
ncbi:hypothetical protein EYF80_051535 [Liparis tanakae]|uniref:Uncharacterized protein n=1 Tax=Liparis tanakae TaxID=230148 RepID=A0A4Z2FAT6_9TELE|nr:hypothetical protein EYF80_051535 [Liparis tanakae]